MKIIRSRKSQHSLAAPLLLIAAVLASASAGAANTNSRAAEDRARYQSERAVCLRGESNQHRETCLREASAAYAESRRGSLDGAASSEYLSNATRRCEALPEPDRLACVARMQGQGTVSGTAQSGGISRELVTTVPAAPPVKK